MRLTVEDLHKQKSKKPKNFSADAQGPVRSCVDLIKKWKDTSAGLTPGFCFPLRCGVQKASSRTALLDGLLRRRVKPSHFKRTDAKARSQP